jgi:hypothetical protein
MSSLLLSGPSGSARTDPAASMPAAKASKTVKSRLAKTLLRRKGRRMKDRIGKSPRLGLSADPFSLWLKNHFSLSH